MTQPSPPSSLTRYLAFSAAAVAGALLLGLYLRALPTAVARARDGAHAARAAACQALQPAPFNPVLGPLPAPAPDFTLKDYAGRPVSLSSLHGQVVLVNFWATWCDTCVVEMPSMEKLVAHEQGKPFRLLAVSVDDDWPTVRKFFAKGTPLDVLLDTTQKVPKAWGTEKFPESFLIDKNGTIRYYIVSNREWDSPAVTACIDAMAAE